MFLFTSTYFIFLGGILLLYWPLSRFRAVTLAVILFANYFFYAKWDLFYLALIPAASTCDYLLGLGIAAAKRPGLRRWLLLGSVALNLGILAAFKYMPFLLENWSALSGRPAPPWHWSFPLGISFYVFQSLTYTLDIYRRDTKPTTSLLAYLAAVSFFPTTLSGPITPPRTLLPQLEKAKALPAAEGGRALFLIGLGLMKKLLIADYLGDNLVNRVFDLPRLYTGLEVLIGVYGYALQLYYDFSGYTDIAIGSALLLGLKLPENFRQPYAALNIADFWRRWHISLSHWLRDYLYFSLPGQRTRWMPPLNLVITMVLGGLWHGPSWNFVVWGLLHGVALAATRLIETWRGRREPGTPAWLRRFATLQFVCLTWVFFRAPNLESALAILERIGSLTASLANVSMPIAAILAIALLAHYVPKSWHERAAGAYAASPFYVQAGAMALLIVAIQYVAATGAAPFIYTRF